jgi:hypothetical protein
MQKVDLKVENKGEGGTRTCNRGDEYDQSICCPQYREREKEREKERQRERKKKNFKKEEENRTALGETGWVLGTGCSG